MRRLLAGVAVLVTAAALLGAARADAATWPAKCKTMACVNDRLNRLHNQDVKIAQAVANLNALLNQCLVVLPLTEYSGYLATDGVTDIPALDISSTGDPVDLWAWGTAPGTCGLPPAARPLTGRVMTHGVSIRALSPRVAPHLAP
jgi:hypothetical protein